MSPALGLILAALALFALSGPAALPGSSDPERRSRAQHRAALLMVLAGVLGLAATVWHLATGGSTGVDLAWGLPGSRFVLKLDSLAAVFLVPVFLVPALAAVYGLGYRPSSGQVAGSRRLDVAQGLLAATMGLVVLAGDGLLFLIAWEAMALSAWLAATVDDTHEVREAGWVYLVATHAGTLCLIAFFALWERSTGSLLLLTAPALEAGRASVLMLLALLGFGLKAGLMPLHIWLPGLHAGAPSQVSAVLSGVMLKMGIYGLVRVSGLLPDTGAGWGVALLVIGASSAVAGIGRGLFERHIKRLLACSSIENIGVITMGLGLALLGRASHRPDWVLLGLAGALLHVWYHAVFKSALFFGAGAVMHATGTGQLDRLGGLGRRMPRTTIVLLAGALSACALPPSSGFLSEWLLYLGFFSVLVGMPPAAAGVTASALAAAALALAGALTLAAFVKVLGSGLLGQPRTPEAARAHDPGPLMGMPMLFAASLTLYIGWFASAFTPVLDAATADWLSGSAASGGMSSASLPPLNSLAPVALVGAASILLILLAQVLARVLQRPAPAGNVPGTWDCGYAEPTTRMQISAASVAHTVGEMLAPGLDPSGCPVRITALFPKDVFQQGDTREFLLGRLLKPAFSRLALTLRGLRVFQQGRTEHYVLYILAALFILLFLSWTGSTP